MSVGNVSGVQQTEDAAMVLLKIAADPQAAKERLEQLTAQRKESEAAQAATQAEVKKLAGARADHDAREQAIVKREGAVSQREASAAVKDRALGEREAALSARDSAVGQREGNVARREEKVASAIASLQRALAGL